MYVSFLTASREKFVLAMNSATNFDFQVLPGSIYLLNRNDIQTGGEWKKEDAGKIQIGL